MTPLGDSRCDLGEGAFWVAQRGSRTRGLPCARWAVPASRGLSRRAYILPAFGGPNLATLYCTTARDGHEIPTDPIRIARVSWPRPIRAACPSIVFREQPRKSLAVQGRRIGRRRHQASCKTPLMRSPCHDWWAEYLPLADQISRNTGMLFP